MKLSRSQLIGLGLVVTSFALHAIFYNRLPDRIPTHWNIAGRADGFMPKSRAAFASPLIMFVVWLVYVLAPARIVPPRGFREKSGLAYDVSLVGVLGFLFIVTGTVFFKPSTGLQANSLMPIAFGFVLVLLGNYIGKTTLTNEEVWTRTRQLAGTVMVAAGMIFIVMAWFGYSSFWLVALLISSLLIPLGYSFFVYRQLQRRLGRS